MEVVDPNCWRQKDILINILKFAIEMELEGQKYFKEQAKQS